MKNFLSSKFLLEVISSQFKDLDPTKASTFGSIPVKMLTEYSDLFAPLVQLFINESIDASNFPKELKKGDIISLFKNGDAFAKKNYRPFFPEVFFFSVAVEMRRLPVFSLKLIVVVID